MLNQVIIISYMLKNLGFVQVLVPQGWGPCPSRRGMIASLAERLRSMMVKDIVDSRLRGDFVLGIDYG